MDAPPVQYMTTSDGLSLAYTLSGEGRPFVYAGSEFSNTQLSWDGQAFESPWLKGLQERFQLVFYDVRGRGMSQRNLGHFEPADDQRDLEALISHLDLSGVVLHSFGIYCHSVVRYALAQPQRVHCLILHNPTPGPWDWDWLEDLAEKNWEMLLDIMAGIGSASLEGRRAAGPSRTRERLGQTASPADFLLRHRAWSSSEASEEMSRLQVPVLVLYPRGLAARVPDAREGSIRVASVIRGARLISIEGDQILGDTGEALQTIEEFLASLPAKHQDAQRPAPPGALSQREVDVLRLLAAGKSNAQIAGELVISQNTVIRHVSNIFAKIGAENRAQAAVFARDHGIG